MGKAENEIIINNASDLGVIIRATRKQLKINQADFAGMCNVGIRFLSELENGKPTLEFDKVVKVTSALGLTLMVRQR